MGDVVPFNIADHHKAARDLIRYDRDTYGDIEDPDSLTDEEVGELINQRYEGGWDTFVADEEKYDDAQMGSSLKLPPPATAAGKMMRQRKDVASGDNVIPFPLNRAGSLKTCSSCNMVLGENEIKISKEFFSSYSCHKCIIKR